MGSGLAEFLYQGFECSRRRQKKLNSAKNFIAFKGQNHVSDSDFFQDLTIHTPFRLAEVFVDHKQLRLPSQEALNAKQPQPPRHQLFKVTLRN